MKIITEQVQKTYFPVRTVIEHYSQKGFSKHLIMITNMIENVPVVQFEAYINEIYKPRIILYQGDSLQSAIEAYNSRYNNKIG